MLEEALCSFEVAKLLKERGFNIPTLAFYWSEKSNMYQSRKDKVIIPDNQERNWNEAPDVMYSCPTHQMAMAWLREEHKIGIFPGIYIFTDVAGTQEYHHYGTAIIDLTTYKLMCDDVLAKDTYEEAVEAALKYVLKNLI